MHLTISKACAFWKFKVNFFQWIVTFVRSNRGSWNIGTEFSRQIPNRIYLVISLFKKLNIQCINSQTYFFVKRFTSLLFRFLYFWIQNIQSCKELFLFFSTFQNGQIIFTDTVSILIIALLSFYLIANPQIAWIQEWR